MKLSVIKMKAKQLKRELGIKQHEALDLVCKQYGFNNYRHYLNTPLGQKELSNETQTSVSLKISQKLS